MLQKKRGNKSWCSSALDFLAYPVITLKYLETIFFFFLTRVFHPKTHSPGLQPPISYLPIGKVWRIHRKVLWDKYAR